MCGINASFSSVFTSDFGSCFRHLNVLGTCMQTNHNGSKHQVVPVALQYHTAEAKFHTSLLTALPFTQILLMCLVDVVDLGDVTCGVVNSVEVTK